MAAANTDKLKKVSRKWVGQIGAGGVADDTVTTIPLSSTTNLPTDTAVVAVIDRVDANGTKTTTAEESVIGVVSGSNLINCTRGAEGTAQAHDAGAVVEILVTAKGWNDIVDWGLVEHLQDGTHGSMTACEITVAGSTAISSIKDEDDMTSNSATALATQQSIKAYVDSGTVTMTNKTLTTPDINGPDIDLTNDGLLKAGDVVSTELTLDASGEIAIPATGTVFVVDTYEDAATDNLENITGGQPGRIIFLKQAANTRDVTIVEGGSIRTNGGANVVLTNVDSLVMLISVSTNSWRVIGECL